MLAVWSDSNTDASTRFSYELKSVKPVTSGVVKSMFGSPSAITAPLFITIALLASTITSDNEWET